MTINTTPNRGYPWPDNTEAVANGWDAIRDLAVAVDSDTEGLDNRLVALEAFPDGTAANVTYPSASLRSNATVIDWSGEAKVTKVGNLVVYQLNAAINAGAGMGDLVANLPYAVAMVHDRWPIGVAQYSDVNVSGTPRMYFACPISQYEVCFRDDQGNRLTQNVEASDLFAMTVTYIS